MMHLLCPFKILSHIGRRCIYGDNPSKVAAPGLLPKWPGLRIIDGSAPDRSCGNGCSLGSRGLERANRCRARSFLSTASIRFCSLSRARQASYAALAAAGLPPLRTVSARTASAASRSSRSVSGWFRLRLACPYASASAFRLVLDSASLVETTATSRCVALVFVCVSVAGCTLAELVTGGLS